MDIHSENFSLPFTDTKQQLEEKIRCLEDNMINLDKRLEKEKQYLFPNMKMKPEFRKERANEVHFESSCTSRLLKRNRKDDKYGMGDGHRVNSDIIPDLMFLQEAPSSPLSTLTHNTAIPEVAMCKPKLFFAWTSSLEDFRTKKIHKTLNKILEEELEENVQKDLLAERITALLEDSLSRSTEEEEFSEKSSKSSCDSPSVISCDCTDGNQLLQEHQKKLTEIQTMCEDGLKFISGDTDNDMRLQECCHTVAPNVINEINSNEENNIMNEDLIIECFKEPDLTDYKSVPFAEVVKELATLESMVKTISDINLPPNLSYDNS